ncbi:hypothetical protein QBC39DRAFT_344785 [Podospora conica]|nr:hypothetical protein QBC39DRAFT_344785 [Schizothecium conicum]
MDLVVVFAFHQVGVLVGRGHGHVDVGICRARGRGAYGVFEIPSGLAEVERGSPHRDRSRLCYVDDVSGQIDVGDGDAVRAEFDGFVLERRVFGFGGKWLAGGSEFCWGVFGVGVGCATVVVGWVRWSRGREQRLASRAGLLASDGLELNKELLGESWRERRRMTNDGICVTKKENVLTVRKERPR